jgi:hypothetical protein
MLVRELKKDEDGKPEDYVNITWVRQKDGRSEVLVSLVTHYKNHGGTWVSAGGGRTFSWSVPKPPEGYTDRLSIPLSLLNEGYEGNK